MENNTCLLDIIGTILIVAPIYLVLISFATKDDPKLSVCITILVIISVITGEYLLKLDDKNLKNCKENQHLVEEFEGNEKPSSINDPKTDPTKYEVTRKRLVKMFKYFKGKHVCCSYEYNNSLGWHEVREHTGVISKFRVVTEKLYHWEEYTMYIYFEDGAMMEETLSDDAMFNGLGRISECNSGPYNFFTIEFKSKEAL